MAEKILGGLRRLFAGGRDAAADHDPKDAIPVDTPASDLLSREQILLAIRDLTTGDPVAEAIGEQVLDGIIDDPDEPFLYLRDFSSPLAAIGHALAATGRIIIVDWRASDDEIFGKLFPVYEKAGIKWPVDAEDKVNRWIADPELDISSSLALVYYALRPDTRAAGHEILDLNAGDDNYHFFLAPQSAANRWVNVRLGDMVGIEHPEYQFRTMFKKNGWEMLFPDHAADNPATAPQA